MRIRDCPDCTEHLFANRSWLLDAVQKAAACMGISVRRALVGYMSVHHSLDHPDDDTADDITRKWSSAKRNLDGSLN